MLEELTSQNLETLIQESKVPLLVDFWAPWCGPCRSQLPILKGLAEASANRYRIAKINVDEQPEAARRFRVSSIPSLLVFRGGQEVERFVGVQSGATLEGALEAAAA